MQYKYWFSYAARIVPINATEPITIQGHTEITRSDVIDGMMALAAVANAIGLQMAKEYNAPHDRVQIQILNWRPFERASPLIIPQGGMQ